MITINVPVSASYGTEKVKSFLSNVYKSIPLDQDGNGKIDTSEWGALVFGVATKLLDGDLYAEIKDLTLEEIKELSLWSDKYFPQLAGLQAHTEDLIAAVFGLVESAVRVVLAAQNLAKANAGEEVATLGYLTDAIETPEIPARQYTPEEIAASKIRTGAVKTAEGVVNDEVTE